MLLSAMSSYKADAQGNRNRNMYSENSTFKEEKGNLLQRMSLGYGMYFTQQKFDFSYVVPKDGSEINVIKNGKVKGGMALNLDFHFPISRISKSSVASISAGVNMINAKFIHDTVQFGGQGSNLLDMKERKFTMIGVPISIDFKTGGDALANKSRRTMFTVGVGVQPSMIQVTEGEQDSIGIANPKRVKVKDPSASYSHFKVAPFAKVEAGFFAGIAFKIRYVAYFGEMGLITESVKDSDFKVKASGGFGSTISLVIMPFSMGWRKE